MLVHAVRSLAVARSPARSLARSLAASGFEISAAVVDVRCPRSDRGHEREPRRSRPRSIDRIASAESLKCPPLRQPGKPPCRGAHTCPHKAEDGHDFVIRRSIDRSNRDPARRRDQTLSIPHKKTTGEQVGDRDGRRGRKHGNRFVIDRPTADRSGRWMQSQKIADEISFRHRSIGVRSYATIGCV